MVYPNNFASNPSPACSCGKVRPVLTNTKGDNKNMLEHGLRGNRWHLTCWLFGPMRVFALCTIRSPAVRRLLGSSKWCGPTFKTKTGIATPLFWRGGIRRSRAPPELFLKTWPDSKGTHRRVRSGAIYKSDRLDAPVAG